MIAHGRGTTTVLPTTITDHIAVTWYEMVTDRIDGIRCNIALDRLSDIMVSRPVFGWEAGPTDDTTVSTPASGSEADRNSDITDNAAAFACVIAVDRRPQALLRANMAGRRSAQAERRPALPPPQPS